VNHRPFALARFFSKLLDQVCRTLSIAGCRGIIEGHVPVAALKRFLAERPNASGLAVPGMPMGAPGMRAADRKNTM
jgi:hypothetical protein